jgi:hypothetical protein
MIHYQLRCSAEHAFDGWFKDSTSFERQAKRGLLECPFCGVTDVERALMTPALAKRGGSSRMPVPTETVEAPPISDSTAVATTKPAPAAMAVDGLKIPDQVRAALQKLRAEVEKNCDYVGADFADETTPEQAETLAEEGIHVARVPWIPRADG